MKRPRLTPQLFDLRSDESSQCDVIVLGAGFEDRAKTVLFNRTFPKHAICILVRFDRSIEGNREVEQDFVSEVSQKFGEERVYTVTLALNGAKPFERNFAKVMSEIPRSHRRVWIDISGLPTHAICTSLRVVREFRPLESQLILYSAASAYVPTKAEFEELKNNLEEQKRRLKDGDDEFIETEVVPRSMALEMSENLIPDKFSGHRTNDGKTALVVFAGYEGHRSAGVIESINPSILLLIYGKPAASDLEWRIELSQILHKGFETSKRSASEVASTLDVAESLEILERYYEHLYDEYDLTISPVCSKMHTVAAYLFWERYKEVQLAFPLPVGYNPSNGPVGVGPTYALELSPSRLLHGTLDVESILT